MKKFKDIYIFLLLIYLTYRIYLIIYTYKNKELCITRRFCFPFLMDSLMEPLLNLFAENSQKVIDLYASLYGS